MDPLMEAHGLVRHFGGLKAVDGVDLELRRGEIHALIGPNGAGKTTLVSLLSGRTPAQAGTICFEGRDITRLPAHARVRLGIAYTFQITQLFARLTVFDNVALAVQSRGVRSRLEREAGEALERVGRAVRIRSREPCPTAISGCWRSPWGWRCIRGF
jgi:branched-chain amino acid transport system ATP-binding protein